ncbi:cation:proton antiporter [Ferviditalea candida]|uniref:Cation:proton antiporter n=1 Tax=Ferviditalea candida TaxID=3108399 RepID=A0ABU5ZMP6_9BACL|nr:cation:proton antiporter [Paenibacillaceae bacterium T2]
MDALQRLFSEMNFQSVHVVISILLLVVFSKISGYISRKLQQPAVVGEIIGGIAIGPSVLGWVEPGSLLNRIGEIGAILLMFIAGIETNTAMLKRVLNNALFVAAIGVAVPFAAGYYLGRYLGYPTSASMLLGTILVSTSVSITVQVLKDMGKLHTIVGTTILAAAVIDDIFGFLILTVVLVLIAPGSESINGLFAAKLSVKLFAFAALTLAGKMIFLRLIDFLKRRRAHLLVVLSLLGIAFCFAFLAEAAGLTGVVGAYLIGMLMSSSLRASSRADINYIGYLEAIGYSVFIPVFFVGFGLRLIVSQLGFELIGLIVTITTLAIFSKIIGCGIGAKISGMNLLSSFQVGVGMVPRGEVGLIVSMIAFQRGIINQNLLSVTVWVVLITTLLTPFMLKGAFPPGEES